MEIRQERDGMQVFPMGNWNLPFQETLQNSTKHVLKSHPI